MWSQCSRLLTNFSTARRSFSCIVVGRKNPTKVNSFSQRVYLKNVRPERAEAKFTPPSAVRKVRCTVYRTDYRVYTDHPVGSGETWHMGEITTRTAIQAAERRRSNHPQRRERGAILSVIAVNNPKREPVACTRNLTLFFCKKLERWRDQETGWRR